MCATGKKKKINATGKKNFFYATGKKKKNNIYFTIFCSG